MIIHCRVVSTLSGQSVSKHSLIFLAVIISKSISIYATNDLNLSDVSSDGHTYDQIHSKHQIESHRSVETPFVRQNYQWVYSSNNNNNHMNVGTDEQPSALTQIDRFFNTGRFSDSFSVSGHFPFDYHQKSGHSFERSMLSFPSMKSMPSLPTIPDLIHLSYPSSKHFLQKDGEMIYNYKYTLNENNYDNNQNKNNKDYGHEIKGYTTHDDQYNHRRWQFTDIYDHSYHRTYDNEVQSNYDFSRNALWNERYPHFRQTYHLNNEYLPQSRTRRTHFSHKSLYFRDKNKIYSNNNKRIVKNDDFFDELQFNWNLEPNNDPNKYRFKHLSFN